MSLFRGDSRDEISIWTLLHCAFGKGGIRVDIGIQCNEATSACEGSGEINDAIGGKESGAYRLQVCRR